MQMFSEDQNVCRPCADDVLIMDGGMGHQLKAMGVQITGPVGSSQRFLGVATANVEHPQLVQDAHLAFIDAGAEVVITNNYACVPKCLELCADTPLGQDIQDNGIGFVIAAAGKAARTSVSRRPARQGKVAGSLPPLNASYRYDLVAPFEENVPKYEMIAKSIAPYSDYLVCETMSTADEARAAVTGAATTGLPIWVSWTLDDVKPVLRSGESLEEAVDAIRTVEGANIQACLFNCSSPDSISLAMPILRSLVPDMKIGAYANGFLISSFNDTVGKKDGLEYRDLSPDEYYNTYVAKWIEAGASIVGGCCGIFPHHIAYIKKQLQPVEDEVLPAPSLVQVSSM